MSDYFDDPYDNDYKAWLLGGILMLVICLAFFGVGCFFLVRQIQATRYVPTEGVIVDHKIHYETGGSNDTSSIYPYYYAIVEYEIDGKTYQKTADTPSSNSVKPPDDLGKTITIYVNPKKPTDVVFKNSTHILLTTLCMIVPVGGFVGTAFLFRKAYKIKKDD